MFVKTGARDLLLRGERQKFLEEEWPRVYATMQRLGLNAKELLDAAKNGDSSKSTSAKTSSAEQGDTNRTREES